MPLDELGSEASCSSSETKLITSTCFGATFGLIEMEDIAFFLELSDFAFFLGEEKKESIEDCFPEGEEGDGARFLPIMMMMMSRVQGVIFPKRKGLILVAVQHFNGSILIDH